MPSPLRLSAAALAAAALVPAATAAAQTPVDPPVAAPQLRGALAYVQPATAISGASVVVVLRTTASLPRRGSGGLAFQAYLGSGPSGSGVTAGRRGRFCVRTAVAIRDGRIRSRGSARGAKAKPGTRVTLTLTTDGGTDTRGVSIQRRADPEGRALGCL